MDSLPKIRVDRLSHKELAYELALYGIKQSTVDDMRKKLRGILRAKPPFAKKYPFSYENELKVLTVTLTSLRELLAEVQGDQSTEADRAKFETRFTVTMKRLDRMPVDGEAEEGVNEGLTAELWAIYGEYLECMDERTKPGERDTDDVAKG